jgi:hypothetical protein
VRRKLEALESEPAAVSGSKQARKSLCEFTKDSYSRDEDVNRGEIRWSTEGENGEFSVRPPLRVTARRDRNVLYLRRRPYTAGGVAPEADPLPAELRHQLNVAASVILELSDRQVDVHFDVDHDTGTVRIHVLDYVGNTIGEISPSSMLEVLAGSRLEI